MTFKDTAVRAEDWIARTAKILAAVSFLGGFLIAGWVQFLGPGLQLGLQGWLGITEIIRWQKSIDKRVPPPQIVNWFPRESRQTGKCFSGMTCTYVLKGARTEYGLGCGRPSGVDPVIILADGRTIQTEFANGYRPAQLAETPRFFEAPLVVPSFVPAGDHAWFALVTYEDCPDVEGKSTRETVEFRLQVSEKPA